LGKEEKGKKGGEGAFPISVTLWRGKKEKKEGKRR